MKMLALRPDSESGFTHVIGIGGIGTGVVFQLEGDHTLGRDESRLGELLHGRDYCKLHIVEHYIATMMGSKVGAAPFQVSAIGVVGEDAAGRQLLHEMVEAGIDTEWVRKNADLSTLFSVCLIYPDGAGGNITASNSAASALKEEDLRQGEQFMEAAAERCIALCLPEVPLEVRYKFLKLATECKNFRVASFALAEIAPAQAMNLFSLIDLIALNIEEASAIVGYACTADNTHHFLANCSAALRSVQPGIRIVISAGAKGAYALGESEWHYYPAPPVPVASTTGAGDALLAGILAGLAAGLPFVHPRYPEHTVSGSEIRSAVELGLLLASFSVTSPHTIHFETNLRRLDTFASSLGISIGSEVRQAFSECDQPLDEANHAVTRPIESLPGS